MKEKKQNIATILKRIEKVEYELSDIRKAIAECMTPTADSSDEPTETDVSFTLDDLCEAFGKKHKAYGVRLCNALARQGVTTFSKFLAMTPGQLLDLDGIGPGTLEYTNKAMKKLGVRW
jgi:hypothetical protein